MTLTDRDLAVLDAYLNAGTCAKAAEDLDLREQTVKNRLYVMRLKARVSSNQQLVYELSDELRRWRRERSATSQRFAEVQRQSVYHDERDGTVVPRSHNLSFGSVGERTGTVVLRGSRTGRSHFGSSRIREQVVKPTTLRARRPEGIAVSDPLLHGNRVAALAHEAGDLAGHPFLSVNVDQPRLAVIGAGHQPRHQAVLR